ncbi:MAG: hypothetical protein IJO74_06015 [Clostridia bacterium]|nr:hypothetical protein [Clostridia bacterium]
MKKICFMFLLILFAVFSISCTQNGIHNATNDENNNFEHLDSDPTSPYSTEDINSFMDSKYKTAKEAFFWFTASSMPSAEQIVDFNNIKEINGIYYYKVGHNSIKNLSDLENYLKSLFSDEIVEMLFSVGKDRYIDIDGELWASDASRGTNIYIGDVFYTITEKSDSKIEYTATVEKLSDDLQTVDEICTYTYCYEKCENGWRWTDFSIFE